MSARSVYPAQVPSVPGYVGVYQFVAATVLPLYGASKTAAVVFSLVTHACNYVIVMVWGLTGMFRLRLDMGAYRALSETRRRGCLASSVLPLRLTA